MHSFLTDSFAFHCDQVPTGDLLIHPYEFGTEGADAFRLDAEEAILFVGALRMGAVSVSFATAGTELRLLPDGMVGLAALAPSSSLCVRQPDDASSMTLPLEDLESFVDWRAAEQHFATFLAEAANGGSPGGVAVGIGMLAAAIVHRHHNGPGTLSVGLYGITIAQAVLFAAAGRMRVIRDGSGCLVLDGRPFSFRDGMLAADGAPGAPEHVRLEQLDGHVVRTLLPRWAAERIATAFAGSVTQEARAAVLAGFLAAALDVDPGH